MNPSIKKGNWTENEDELIFLLYKKYNSSWSKISKYLIGRTENAVKNRFYSTLRRLTLENKKKKNKKNLDYKNEKKSEAKKMVEELIEKINISEIEKNLNKNSKDEIESEDINKKILELQNSLKDKPRDFILKEENKEFENSINKKVNKNDDENINYQNAFDNFVKEEENSDQMLVFLIQQLDQIKDHLQNKFKEKTYINEAATQLLAQKNSSQKIGFVKASKNP